MQNEELEEIMNSIKEKNLNKVDIVKIAIRTENIHIKELIMDHAEEYGLKFYDIYRIAMSTDNLQLKEKAIESAIQNGESGAYGVSANMYINKITASTNNYKFIKKIISNPDYYRLDVSDIATIVFNTDNIELTEEVIDNSDIYGLDNEWILEIANKTQNLQLKEKIIANAKKFKLSEYDVMNIVKKAKDIGFAKNIIDNASKYRISGDTIANFIIDTKNIELAESVIDDAEKYKLNEKQIFQIAASYNDEELIKKIITSIDPKKYNLIKSEVSNYRSNHKGNSVSLDFIKNNLQIFLKIENATDKEETLLRMYEKNNDILKVKSFNILDERILKRLGEDKVNLISCYDNVTEKVGKLNDRELELINSCLNLYLNLTKGEEWVEVANAILENISEYKELIENINNNDEVDINTIMPIIIHPNIYGIKTIEDVNKFQEIKLKRCDKLIKGNIKEKKEAVMQKIFGIGIEEARSEVRKFGNNIEDIQDEELKIYIKSIQRIVDLKDPELLIELFNNVKGVESVNPILIERMLKNEYGKMYNKDLFRIEDGTPVEGYSNVYEAGTDFKMLITSVAPYAENQPDNYYKDWNRPSLWSQFFCASYIRNDMMGHATVPHICYGFTEMADDALIMSGTYDIYSENGFVAKSENEECYYSPDRQINETIDLNEMDFRRIQNGKKKQPDYIVVFREGEKIENMEKAQKASEEFNGLPIVIIDVDKCLESEKQKVEELYREYSKNKDQKVRQKLYQKIKNNRITCSSFCEDIYEELYDEQRLNKKVNEKDLETIYQEIDATDRQEENGKMQKLYKEIKMTLKEGDKNGR